MRPPEKLTIDTPEQIALEFPLAGAGSRFLALAIDTFVQIGGPARAAASWASSRSGFARSVSVARAPGSPRRSILLGFLLYYGYFAAFEALWGGQTPGKRVVGLRVIIGHGPARSPPSTRSCATSCASSIRCPGIYAVGGAVDLLHVAQPAAGRSRRGHSRRAGAGPAARHGDVDAGAPRTRLGAARLSIEEVEVIQAFLTRRADLPEYSAHAHRRSARQPHPAAAGAPGGQPPDDEALIEAIAAEYRRR